MPWQGVCLMNHEDAVADRRRVLDLCTDAPGISGTVFDELGEMSRTGPGANLTYAVSHPRHQRHPVTGRLIAAVPELPIRDIEYSLRLAACFFEGNDAAAIFLRSGQTPVSIQCAIRSETKIIPCKQFFLSSPVYTSFRSLRIDFLTQFFRCFDAKVAVSVRSAASRLAST